METPQTGRYSKVKMKNSELFLTCAKITRKLVISASETQSAILMRECVLGIVLWQHPCRLRHACCICICLGRPLLAIGQWLKTACHSRTRQARRTPDAKNQQEMPVSKQHAKTFRTYATQFGTLPRARGKKHLMGSFVVVHG